MSTSIFHEITPLSEKDCFMVFSREKEKFDFPLHVHSEFEINFIENARYAQRIVGDNIEEIEDLELALIASPDLEHGWFTHKCKSKKIKEITIQFHPGLLNEHILQKIQFRSIHRMFEKAVLGISFSQKKIHEIKDSIYQLAKEREGFYSVIKLFTLLHRLSLDKEMRVLSSSSFHEKSQKYDSRRIEKAINYLTENFKENVTLKDVSDSVGMSEVSFSRFFKRKTGRTFVDTLNEIRLGHASRMLVDTTHGISEIAWLTGFNNLSNFNRTFKKKKGYAPSTFREKYRDTKFYL